MADRTDVLVVHRDAAARLLEEVEHVRVVDQAEVERRKVSLEGLKNKRETPIPYMYMYVRWHC